MPGEKVNDCWIAYQKSSLVTSASADKPAALSNVLHSLPIQQDCVIGEKKAVAAKAPAFFV